MKRTHENPSQPERENQNSRGDQRLKRRLLLLLPARQSVCLFSFPAYCHPRLTATSLVASSLGPLPIYIETLPLQQRYLSIYLFILVPNMRNICLTSPPSA